MKQKNIFVLRNNDLGDVLVATPLVEALKNAYPESKISIGVGDWAKPLLGNNPNLDEIISCNAPWHNKQNCRFPANSPKTFLKGCFMCLFLRNHERSLKKSLPMALMYLVVAKVLGFYEEQESLTDLELEVMLAETIGALIAFNSEKIVK